MSRCQRRVFAAQLWPMAPKSPASPRNSGIRFCLEIYACESPRSRGWLRSN
jgi:hypothetical protein